MSAAHTPCVLTPLCGPHCGLDRGYLGHCPECHSCEPTGRFGHHETTARWLISAQREPDPVLRWLPDLSPPPG